MMRDEPEMDYVERLKHLYEEKHREREFRRRDRLFALRQVLNVIFILMAVVAMVGIALHWESGTPPWCYLLAIVAVMVKMVEAMFRMPGMLRRPRRSDRIQRGEGEIK